MNRTALFIAGIAIAGALIVASFCLFTVNQMQVALVTQFGAPQEVVLDPGLHAKLPWQTVYQFDKRLLLLDAAAEEVITEDKKRLVVDAFARWRIVDPLRFYQSLTDEDNAGIKLTPLLSSNVRTVLGSQSFAAVLSVQRAALMRDIRDDMNRDAAGFGIRIVDVRIRRADLPLQNSQAVYGRMQQERKREANEFRAEGSEISVSVKARADREVTVLVAEATRESEILRGQGDAEKTKTLGEAYGADPDFFAFYRSMQAYQDALPGSNTTMVLSPNSEFFKYFGQTGAAAAHK
ncbi:MAG TPA: protease modulator HflC [Rhizomicrobium sp.]|nr:protease modulator HflC [Rhizomicrobium sp.]